MRKGLATLVVAIGMLAAVAAPASAIAPTTTVIPIDFSFVPSQLSAACGFAVTRHVEGRLTIRVFVDADGNFVREADAVRQTETLSANGRTLIGRTTQNIVVTLRADGSYTVAFMGSDFRVTVPGAGVTFGSVGRFVVLFAADDSFLGVLQDVGNIQGDVGPICAALSP
jgi:hypothetical protein